MQEQTTEENLQDNVKVKKQSINRIEKKSSAVKLTDNDEQELLMIKNKGLDCKKNTIKKKRGEGSDAKKVIKRIQDFDREKSPACIKLNSKFGRGIVHEELKSIAEFLCVKLHIDLDRDAKRDNRVLYKWFHENWDVIEPEIERIELFDKDHNPIK